MTLFTHPFVLLIALAALALFVPLASRIPAIGRVYSVIPSLFWIYVLPMLGSTFGLFPHESPVYTTISGLLLPASLILLLIPVNLKTLAHLELRSLLVFLAGTLGTMVGCLLLYLLLSPYLPQESWGAFGALSASWVGGSINMVAVKEALGVPDAVFLPMVIVDSVVAYTWMGFLIALAPQQEKFDRWNKATDFLPIPQTTSTPTAPRAAAPSTWQKGGNKALGLLAVLLVTALGTLLVLYSTSFLPEIKGFIARATWAVILASVVGLLLALTPAHNASPRSTQRIGYFLLYLVLASIGARGDLSRMGQAPLLIVGGFLWITIHGLCILGAVRLLKAPLGLGATASQANIGGPASAPIVGSSYHAELAPIGLLLAIIGNILGTYTGILTAHLCRWLS